MMWQNFLLLHFKSVFIAWNRWGFFSAGLPDAESSWLSEQYTVTYFFWGHSFTVCVHWSNSVSSPWQATWTKQQEHDENTVRNFWTREQKRNCGFFFLIKTAENFFHKMERRSLFVFVSGRTARCCVNADLLYERGVSVRSFQTSQGRTTQGDAVCVSQTTTHNPRRVSGERTGFIRKIINLAKRGKRKVQNWRKMFDLISLLWRGK